MGGDTYCYDLTGYGPIMRVGRGRDVILPRDIGEGSSRSELEGMASFCPNRCCCLLLRRKTARANIALAATMPPTTTPTIGPIFDEVLDSDSELDVLFVLVELSGLLGSSWTSLLNEVSEVLGGLIKR